MKKQKNKKGLLKKLGYGAAGLAVLGVLYIARPTNKNYLKPENFDQAEWTESYNPDGIIWDDYMKENIPHNTPNWHLYIDKVREKNSGKLEGRILLPDLDSSGK